MNKVAELKRHIENKEFEAGLDLCNHMIVLYPEFSFYKFWKSRLESQKLNSLQCQSVDNRNTDFLSQISKEITRAFKQVNYVINEPQVFSDENLDEIMKKLADSLPFKGEIYLPTNEISLKDQVTGIQKVSQLVSEENKRISQERFKRFKQILKEKGKTRIFIIGNGPSLNKTDLNLLKDEITIGFNGIFLHKTFKPTIHIVEDHLVAEDRIDAIINYNCPVKIYPSYLGYCIPAQDNTIFLNHLPRVSFPVDTDFSDDAGRITYAGGTVTYTGLQVAASLGFEEIILVGVDASYKVENVERSENYGTGVLRSNTDDQNHFDPSYFGKGYRWHDPNVHTMLQAYRKVRNYAELTGRRILNATIGGELEVFPRVDFYDLFETEKAFPKIGIIDFTHINWRCATGIVKKNMFDGWAKSALFHVHAQNPDYISAYQAKPNDCYPIGSEDNGIWAALRSVMEFRPDVLYLRPVHDRPEMTIFQMALPFVLNRPYVMHYMDDWISKLGVIKDKKIQSVYADAMRFLFHNACRVLTISDKMSDYLHRVYRIPESKLQVVHNYIQPQKIFAIPQKEEHKVVRYFGGMEPDMSLGSLHLVAKTIDQINGNGRSVKFEIYTNQDSIDKFNPEFSQYKNTKLLLQIDGYDDYLTLLSSSDLNLLCYNFDHNSELYLKYSMANKLPECLNVDPPFMAIGSEEIGTITYLKQEDYPFTATQNSSPDIFRMISHILFETGALSAEYFECIMKMKEEFSEHKNRCCFQNMLRQVNNMAAPGYAQKEVNTLKRLLKEFQEVLPVNGKNLESVKCLETLICLSNDQKERLLALMTGHGVNWQFTSSQEELSSETGNWIKQLAFLIITLDNERFSQTTQRIKGHFI